jgi:hypothetical protein
MSWHAFSEPQRPAPCGYVGLPAGQERSFGRRLT